MSQRMPVIFLGHGNPMNAIQDNVWARSWADLGRRLPRPRAVLSVSAHWYIPETAVTAMPAPRTIHDFGGFPQALFDVQYPAPGDPDLAARVQAVLSPLPVRADMSWGLDHGTWSVLRHVFPQADIPVVQLAINREQPPEFHYQLGQRLRPLRDEGVLILGSGNVVHNLRAYAWKDPSAEPFDWAAHFENLACELIQSGNHAPLIDYPSLGEAALLSIPTPDHYLPLLYVLGASEPGEAVRFNNKGTEGASMSMLSIEMGGAQVSQTAVGE